MKTGFKRIFAVLSILVILLSFSGCSNPSEAMDEARKKHAYYTDSSFESIRFDGKTYIKYTKEIPFEVFDAGTAYLTAKNVPAIMASTEGVSIEYNQNKTALAVDDWKNDIEMIYVQKGFEEEFEAIVASGVNEFFCTSNLTGKKTLEVADGTKKEAIEKTLAGEPLNPQTVPQNLEHVSAYWKVDKDFTLMQEAFSVHRWYGGCYYLDTGYGVYEVPSEYSSLFDFEYEKNYFDYEDYQEYYGTVDYVEDSIILQ